MKQFLVATIIFGLSSISYAGPGYGMRCEANSPTVEYSALFEKAVMGPLIWVTLKYREAEIARIACAAEQRRPGAEMQTYLCENGVDDRYHANPDDYRVRLIHRLPHGDSRAVVYPPTESSVELDWCKNL